MEILTKHFKEVENNLGLPLEAVKVFEKYATKIEKTQSLNNRFEKIFNEYLFPEAHDFGKCFKELKPLSNIYGIKEYTLDFVFLLRAAEVMHTRYRERGLSDELFWDSIMDLKYKYRECVNCKGVHGTFVPWWNTEFFALRRFALGRYQFDMSSYGGEDFTTSSGIIVKKGDKTLNFHIPSSGVPLTDDVRLDSLKKAYEFFTDFRRDDGLMIFECGSWLIYEEYKNFLPEKSNIIRFIKDFEIVSMESCDNFDDAWRIFDKYGYKSPKNWPEDTSLRRAFKHHVLSGGKTGHGHGIIVFDGEKIVI